MTEVKLFVRGLFSLCMIGMVLGLSAQGMMSATYSINQLGLDEGLPHRTVLSSTLDKHQLLWLSTEAGLCRYDGYRINLFSSFPQRFDGNLRNSKDSLLLSVIRGYPDSLEVFDPVSQLAWGTKLSRMGEGVFAGTSHRSGQDFYFAQGAFVYRLNRKNEAEPVFTLKREIRQKERLIDASPKGYLLYRPDLNELEEMIDGELFHHSLPPGKSYEMIHREGSGTLWIGDEATAFKKLPDGDSFVPVPRLPSGDVINRVYEDDFGNIIVGHLHPFLLTMADLVAYNDKDTVSLQPILERENRIITVEGHDFRKSIRAATHGGLYTLTFSEPRNNPFTNFLAEADMPSGSFGHLMRGFTADDDGNVYANKDSKNPWWFRLNIDDYSLDTLLMQDNAGEVVNQFGCGTNLINHQGDIYGMSCFRADVDTGHVYRYRPKTDSWKRWTLPEQNQVVRWIMKGRTADELMLATQHSKNDLEGLLYYFYPARDSFSVIRPAGPEFYIAGYTKSAKIDTARNGIWLGTTKGLYHFDVEQETLTRYLLPNGQATSISDIIVRKSGDLLVGTFKYGLQMFYPREERFEHVGGISTDLSTTGKPDDFLHLPSSYIAAIQVTKPENYLIITSFNGLFFHGPETGITYTTDQGLPSNEFNTPSLFYNEKDGRWYAGGINGFTSFATQDLIPDHSPFQPLLLSYRQLDEDKGYEEIIPVSPHYNTPLVIKPSISYFAFDYTIPDYTGPGVKTYQTRLEGYDRDWRAATSESFVRYTQLPAGEYTFQLRATDGFGRQTAAIREVSISVLKPWYKQNWFYFICLAGFAGLINYWHHLRLRRLEKEHLTERKVQSLELRALRQQLSPHFISNAMNAIREYIYSEEARDNKHAADYLTDFSQLMRLFLESSRKRFTTVGDEVKMLERYVGLEQLRFSDKFTYSIEVDKNIDQDMDEVPSLLLQPLVENAIHHGLFPLKAGGELIIRFELDEDQEAIKCTISDNGVGRKIAALKPKNSGHISRSTEIMEDRRELLLEHDDIDLQVSISDLHAGREHTGTVVMIRF